MGEGRDGIPAHRPPAHGAWSRAAKRRRNFVPSEGARRPNRGISRRFRVAEISPLARCSRSVEMTGGREASEVRSVEMTGGGVWVLVSAAMNILVRPKPSEFNTMGA